tara:strand:- start:1053 stop:1391 length:339 start_codon:yes stop_codon:yes gene_type:complete
MKAIPIKFENNKQVQCKPEEATFLKFHIPSVARVQTLPVIINGSRQGTNCWTWNGDTEKPTLRPSVLVTGYCGDIDADFRCHSWINDGSVQFLSDCSHELANKTVELLDISL